MNNTNEYSMPIKPFLFTEKQVHDEVRHFLKKQDKSNDNTKNIKIKKCAWTAIRITQNVKPYVSEVDAKSELRHTIKRFYNQHYKGGLF